MSRQFEEVADYLMNNNAKNVYVRHPSVDANLSYIFLQRGVEINIIFPPANDSADDTDYALQCCDYAITTNRIAESPRLTYIGSWDYDVYLSMVVKK